MTRSANYRALTALVLALFVVCLPAVGVEPDPIAIQIADVELVGIRLGVLVLDASGAPVVSHRADEPFVLASNTKLFTTAAALWTLPPTFRWTTTARLDGKRLWIIGSGDASFATVDSVSYPDKFLDEVAERLKKAGVRSLQELIVDARYFDRQFQHPYWPQDQLREGYSAPVSGLPYARGMVRVRGGKGSDEMATFTPVKVTANFVEYGLEKRGIKVAKSRFAEGAERAPGADQTLYTQESPFALADVVRQTNTWSDNFFAEHLLKTLGAEAIGEGSFEAGLLAVREALEHRGIPLAGYGQIDGSGLARIPGGGNRCTPTTMNALLRTMAADPNWSAVFLDSLSVGGVTGTLASRFAEAPFRGHLHAKTGYIVGALTLSGYLVTSQGNFLTFSILANDDASTFERRERIRAFQLSALTALWERLQASERKS